MKKLLTLFVLSIGIFALAGVVSAATAEELQPATTTYIEDELQVLGTARAYSIRIGAQGYGGVTFFNGTIINETTDVDSGAEMPVTFGDDVRIDGRIWRGENPGAGLDDDRELVVNDDMEVTGSLSVGNLVGTGVVNSANIEDGTITGADIASSADLSVDSISATGDIDQELSHGGAMKAMAYVTNSPSLSVSRSWTYNDSDISISNDGTTCILTFDFNVNERYWNVTPTTEGFSGAAKVGSSNNVLEVDIQYNSTGTYHITPFMLTIY